MLRRTIYLEKNSLKGVLFQISAEIEAKGY